MCPPVLCIKNGIHREYQWEQDSGRVLGFKVRDSWVVSVVVVAGSNESENQSRDHTARKDICLTHS